ncbi:MAG: ADP-glyceromanno-heptose 6-epimerase [Sedimentisphaeraceae bacterium JB056]
MIIVTGGAGFIGSAIIAGLNKAGFDDIIVVDELGSDEKWKNLRRLKFADYLEKEDFLELVLDADDCIEADAVIHMGACSSTTETDCSFLINNNYQYTKELCNWSLENNARFIYASSAATYGDGDKGFDDNIDLIDELEPLNMYGYSKHIFDKWAMKSGAIDHIAGLKFFNVFGPNEYHKANMISFVLRAYQQIKETGKVKLFKSHRSDYKDGEQLRDFVYIKDVVDMTLFFLDNPETNGIYNIGTGQARSWNDLSAAVFEAMSMEPNIEYIPMPEILQGKYQYYTKADIKKLKNAGYDKPVTSLENAVTDYVQNYIARNDYLHAGNY